MIPILAKIGLPQAVGLYCDGRSVYVSHVVQPLGAIELQQSVEPLETGEEGASAIMRAVEKIRAPRAGLRLALGVSTDRCYFATRPTSSTAAASPRALLRESLRCSSVPVDKMEADYTTCRPDRREVASIVACSRDLIDSFGEILNGREERLIRAEPAPCALLRLALKQDRKRVRSKPSIRVFLNAHEALGLLAADGRPIVWRTASLAQGDEASTILTLVRTLVSVAEPSGVDCPPERVVIHGCREIEGLIDTDWLRQQLPAPYQWLMSPAFDGREIAQGLALGALEEDAVAFNLAKEHCRPAKLVEMIPWRELTACATILLAMACVLSYRSIQLDSASETSIAASRRTVAESLPTGELEQEKKDLNARVSAVSRFVDSRVMWSAYLRMLSASLPQNVHLTSIDGEAAFEKQNKGKAKRTQSLVIKGAVSLPKSGLIPQEVDQLLDAIREHPLITDRFPIVELADLKRLEHVDDDQDYAMFTVVCMPKGRKKP